MLWGQDFGPHEENSLQIIQMMCIYFIIENIKMLNVFCKQCQAASGS